MGLFSKASTSEVDSSAKVTWVKNASKKDLSAQWAEIVNRLHELLTGDVLYYPEQQKNLLSSISLIRDEWMLIDKQLMTDEESVNMYWVINKEMPNLIMSLGQMKAERSSSSANHEGNYLEISKRVRQMQEGVMRLRAKTDAEKLSRFTDPANSNSHQNLSTLSFPAYPDLPVAIQEKLAEIGVLWRELQDETHTTENEYLLERLVTDYIPSSVELYQSFTKARESQLQEAQDTLSAQLELIKQRVSSIQEGILGQQLKAMNAQTDFLTQRLNGI
jgi:hypothetical protein